VSASAGGIRDFFLILLALLCFAHAAMAQDLTPRAYLITPVGANATTLSYSNLEGNLDFNGAVPITGATANLNLAVATYYHSLDFFGRSANVALGVPYGVADFKGTVVEAPRSAHRSGLLDSAIRFSVNLMGGPAMEPAEFAKWQQKTLLGVSLQIVAPTGQYEPTQLINLGSNRWTFKPEIGYSRRWGHWILDGYGGVNLFTQNPEFFSRNSYFPGTRTQSENSVIDFEGHLSYDFRARLWVSLDANFWRGGATSLNGVENPITNQKSSRVGMTASVPLTAHQSIKISLSDGAYVRYGGNYKSISVAWQYGWLGWPKFQ
jgi:hypothetical protein